MQDRRIEGRRDRSKEGYDEGSDRMKGRICGREG